MYKGGLLNLCSDPDMGHHLLHHLLLLITVWMLACPAVSGLFEWLRTSQPPPAETTTTTPVAPAVLAKDARFEMMTADEKFLAEAKQLELSPLDSCHYRVNMVFYHCSFSEKLFSFLDGLLTGTSKNQVSSRTSGTKFVNLYIKALYILIEPD